MLLKDQTDCFCFLAGHESFAAAEGAIGIARTANKARKSPLRVILNGLGKDAAYIISRINGFTYVETEYCFDSGDIKVVREVPFSKGDKSKVRVYGCNDVLEGVAIMKLEKVDVSITGNSTNPTRFQHLVAGTYKKWAGENDVRYFSVASGAEQDVRFILIIWLLVQHHMDLQTQWVACMAMHNSLVLRPFLLTLK